MTEIEQFIANSKLFRCERLSANLTTAQCDANRSRYPVIFQCEDCAGLGKAVELEERMGYGKDKECVACKQIKPVMARGLCPSCYHKKRNAGDIDTVPIVREMPAKIAAKMKAKTSLPVKRFDSLLPIVTQPAGRMITIPESLAPRLVEISDEDIIALLDMLVSEQLARRAA
jgi:hypothetical protein